LLVRAQCDADTHYIYSQADADALSSCTTLRGNVSIASNDSKPFALRLDGIVTIQGDLTTNASCTEEILASGPSLYEALEQTCSNVTSISSSTLQTVEGIVQFESMSDLMSIELPALTSMGSFEVYMVASLRTLTLGPILNITGTFVIEFPFFHVQYTGLNNLTDLFFDTVSTFGIVHNVNMTSLSASFTYVNTAYVHGNSNLTDVTLSASGIASLTVHSNGVNTSVSLPQSTTLCAYMCDFNSISDLSIPLLSSTPLDMNIEGSSLTSIDFPNLVSGFSPSEYDYSFLSLTLQDNPLLESISIPKATSLSNLFLKNNTALKVLDGFPLVEYIGAMGISGNFERFALLSPCLDPIYQPRGNVLTMGSVDFPALNSTIGLIIINSTVPNFSCAQFDDYRNKGYIQGSDYWCQNTTLPENTTAEQLLSKSGKSSATVAGASAWLYVTVGLVIGIWGLDL
jgi:hypothetical protein